MSGQYFPHTPLSVDAVTYHAGSEGFDGDAPIHHVFQPHHTATMRHWQTLEEVRKHLNLLVRQVHLQRWQFRFHLLSATGDCHQITGVIRTGIQKRPQQFRCYLCKYSYLACECVLAIICIIK